MRSELALQVLDPVDKERLQSCRFCDRMNVRQALKQLAEHHADLAARYAALLERYCLMAPLQWYNFFDFWAADGDPDRGAR